jgi:thiamine biosynthesis lipoprotein
VSQGGHRTALETARRSRQIHFRGRIVWFAAALLGMGLAGALPAADSATDAPQAAAGAPRRSVSYPIRTMGTYGQVILVTADSAASYPIARAALAAFTRIDSLMSNWTTTSEVARLNREAAHGATLVQPEVATVLDASLRTWRDSDGVFDITVEPLVRLWGFIGGPRRVPSDSEIAATLPAVGARQLHFDPTARTLRFDNDRVKIDLGGIAKGYAVDVAAETLRARGVKDALVDLSGNMVALGSPVGSDRWRIGIRDPRGQTQYFARLRVHEAISTSGQYEQFVAVNGRAYGHILNPRTGRPAEGLISVTVVAPTGLDCDAWDTPLFVLGPEAARRKAKALENISAILVQPGEAGVDTVWVEKTLEDRFTLEPEARARFVVKYF